MEWFRHDYYAANDIKIRKLLRNYGECAYGAYWIIVELLYQQDGTASSEEINDAFELMSSPGMKDILANSGLFQISEDGSWTSKRVNEEIEYLAESRRKKSYAGKKGMASRWGSADNNVITDDNTVITPPNTPITDDNTIPNHTIPIKKEVVSKDTPKKKVFQRPSLEEVKAYCQERNNSVDPQAFLDFYESKGWMIGKNHMKDWKAAVRTWEKADAKNPRSSYDTIKGTNIKMSLVADGTRGRFEPEVKFD